MNNIRAESDPNVHREIGRDRVYRVGRAPERFGIDALSSLEKWGTAQIASIASFHPSSTDHRPQTQVRVLADQRSIHVRFDVEDRYVRSIQTKHQNLVSKDSCVEFFVQPFGSSGYFNFEVNAGGAMLVYFIEDPARGPNGAMFTKFVELPIALVESLPIYHSLPKTVDPERTEPTSWSLAFSIPKSLIEQYVPRAWSRRNLPWRCNFHKCGDETSHPHWGSWAAIGQTLRFHQPAKFGHLEFDLRGIPDLLSSPAESTA